MCGPECDKVVRPFVRNVVFTPSCAEILLKVFGDSVECLKESVLSFINCIKRRGPDIACLSILYQILLAYTDVLLQACDGYHHRK